MLLILEATLLLAIAWFVKRVVRFGRLVYAMRSVPCIPECFPFSLPLDLAFSMKKSKSSSTKKPYSSTLRSKSRTYPRLFFKVMQRVLGDYYGQPVVGFFFGPIAFINAVTPEAAEAILSSTNNLNKWFTYHFIKPWLGKGLLSNPDSNSWRLHRKYLTPSLHFHVLEDYRTIMNRCSLRLLEKLANGNNNVFDIVPVIRMTTFSILFESAFGIELNEDDPEHMGFLDDCDELASIILVRMMNVHQWPDVLFALTKEYRQMRKLSDRISRYVYKVIDWKMAETSQEANPKGCETAKSFMLILISMHRRGLLSREEIRDHVATFIVGGFDTTAASLAYTIHLLGNHPDILKALQLEVDATLHGEEFVTKEHINMMSYLDAVCKESLRLFPSVPMVARDLTQPIRIGSIDVPAGTTGLVHIYHLHRNPYVWDRPNEFEPERFLDPTEKRHPYAFIPFSAGPRNCIGQKFALQEDKILLVHIVRNFNLKSYQKTEDLRLSMELILRPIDGLLVQFEPRI